MRRRQGQLQDAADVQVAVGRAIGQPVDQPVAVKADGTRASVWAAAQTHRQAGATFASSKSAVTSERQPVPGTLRNR